MKTIFRFFSLAALASGVAVGGAMAQDAPAANPCTEIDAANASYAKFTENHRKKAVADLKSALDAGKEYLQKWGECPDFVEQVKYVKPWVAKLEVDIPKIEEGAVLAPLFATYDEAIKTDNTAQLFTSGKAILAKKTDDLNIMLPLALAVPREVAKKNYTYNADSLRYAKIVLDKLRSGAPLTRKNAKGEEVVGVLKYEMTRENAISELLHSMAYTNFYSQSGNKKEAVQYYYEVTKTAGPRKEAPTVYATLGDYYLMERTPIGKEIVDLIAKLKAATADDEKIKLDAEIKAKEALFKGYTERAMDALSRAYSLSKDAAFKAGVYKDLKQLYEVRFEKADGLDTWISSAVAKPLPDPTTTVQPIVEAETTTTTSTTGTGTGVGAANGTGTGAANGTGVGAANGTGVAVKPAVAKTKP